MTIDEYITDVDAQLDRLPPFPNPPDRAIAWAAWWLAVEQRNLALEPRVYDRPVWRKPNSRKSAQPPPDRPATVCPSPSDTIRSDQGLLKFRRLVPFYSVEPCAHSPFSRMITNDPTTKITTDQYPNSATRLVSPNVAPRYSETDPS